MKAIQLNKFGDPTEVLQITETQTPKPKPNEVLIKVITTTINDYDWSIVTGKPKAYGFLFGWTKPKIKIPGMELAGIIESVGANVTHFKAGDHVFGDISDHGFGTLAEYICIDEKAIMLKPNQLSFEEIVTVPHAGGLAWQALKQIKENQDILINGAGGGVGSIAVQICKQFNCKVTGVDSNDKKDLMLSMGYDRVIDYQSEDFTKLSDKYDFVLDCKSNRPAHRYLKALKPSGQYVTVGGSPLTLIRLLLTGILIRPFTSKRLSILALKANKGIDELLHLWIQKDFKTAIDGPYSIEKIPELVEYFGKGNHKGKIVISVID